MPVLSKSILSPNSVKADQMEPENYPERKLDFIYLIISYYTFVVRLLQSEQ